MLFYVSLFAIVALIVLGEKFELTFARSNCSITFLLALHRYRSSIAPYLPEVPHRVKSLFPRLNNYIPLSTFADQAGAGMSSSNFDIEANILDGDSRSGLDEHGTQEVMEIMRRERVK